MIYIFDLDGTVADMQHRLPFIQSATPDWSAFYQACDQDKPIAEIIEVNRSLNSAGNNLSIITGRSDECREKTERWLHKNGVFFDSLWMRRDLDYRPDHIVKSELLDMLITAYPTETIGGVFEDRRQVVDMYRRRGIRVFQVAEGNF